MAERTRPIRIEFCVTEQERKLIQNKIYVITKASSSETSYNSDNPYEAQSSDATYINPSAQFQSYLCENDNGVVSGILFIQDGADGPDSAEIDDLTIIGYNPA